MAATRISKNSSRLLAEIDRNFKRSSSGLSSSDASSSTRRLNASQEVSRFRKYWGLSSEIRAMIDALTAFSVLGVISLLADETTRRKPTKHQYKAFRARADQRKRPLQY